MWDPRLIEDIDAMRRREGIDDVELREDVGALAVGDFVRLTLLPRDRSFAGETLSVRITGIHGSTFQGKLADPPASKGLAELRVGTPLVFSAAHIHSIPKGRPAHGY